MLELYRIVTRAIPAYVEMGAEMAGSTRFKFRSRDDPRYTDRRMQNLLRKLESSIDKYTPAQLTQLCKIK